MKQTLLEAWGQLRFPKELRIESHHAALAIDEPAAIDKLLAGLMAQAAEPAAPQAAPDAQDHLPAGYVRLTNAAWRISQQVARVGDATVARALRGKVDLLLEVLRAEGIEVIDATGRDFDFGDRWDDVITSADAKQRPYIESMRSPRIMHHGRLVQAGTPVVADRPPRTP